MLGQLVLPWGVLFVAIRILLELDLLLVRPIRLVAIDVAILFTQLLAQQLLLFLLIAQLQVIIIYAQVKSIILVKQQPQLELTSFIPPSLQLLQVSLVAFYRLLVW
jgi:hypothetical protein